MDLRASSASRRATDPSRSSSQDGNKALNTLKRKGRIIPTLFKKYVITIKSLFSQSKPPIKNSSLHCLPMKSLRLHFPFLFQFLVLIYLGYICSCK
mmetsp:Transcript_20616/g.41255  ORF Transcript_20616/g.41255 Transcript_20616/m.41255 type:complete len:96 (-) Transcript_20616:114-401(-)